MSKKTISILFLFQSNLIFGLILVKYFELFTIPGWLMGRALILASLTFLMNGISNRKKKIKADFLFIPQFRNSFWKSLKTISMLVQLEYPPIDPLDRR